MNLNYKQGYKMTTVWIVVHKVTWSNLEETIEGVFSDELLAIDYIDQQNNPGKYEIHEWDLI